MITEREHAMIVGGGPSSTSISEDCTATAAERDQNSIVSYEEHPVSFSDDIPPFLHRRHVLRSTLIARTNSDEVLDSTGAV